MKFPRLLRPGVAALLLACLRPGPAAAAPAPTPERPNFILIVADDLGYGDIGPFGSVKNRTPHLDRMAREGMRLTSFYGAPVCTPSRAQILTGCYAKRVGLPDVIFPAAPIGLNAGEHCIAELLKARGYATMAIGKWHVGDHPDFLPTRHGFDQYFGLPYSNDMGGPADHAKAVRERRPPLPLVRDGQTVETVTPDGQNRLTERYTDEAVKFIRAHRDAPFFLYLPHTAVHVPLHPGDQFRGKSANGRYGDWVEELDWSVGRVLDTVRDLGLSDRTLVCFTSDNGPWLTQKADGGVAGPLRGGKGGTYEGGVREPTIAWWPGHIAATASLDAIAANLDFLPTFVHLAGGEVPSDHVIDGRDLSPLLFGHSTQSPHEAFFYFSGNALQAVRSGPWKYAVARQNEALGQPADPAAAAAPFHPTLYHLDTDIGERHDVAGENPEVVRRLQGLIDQMAADLGRTNLGPGVRQAGRVAHPVGLWLPGQEPSPELLAAHYDLAEIDKLAIGDSLPAREAPQIAGKALVISVDLDAQGHDGVIVAHGGASNGYSLHLHGGKPVFTVRIRRKPVAITSDAAPGAPFHLEARLNRDGTMSLAVNARVVATGRAEGPIPAQPSEDFCVGHDNGRPVGDYDGKARFPGVIHGLAVRTVD